MKRTSRSASPRRIADKSAELVALGRWLDAIRRAAAFLDARGRIIVVNRSFHRLTGWSTADSVGRRFDRLLCRGKAATRAGAVLRRALATGKLAQAELCLRAKRGGVFSALVDIQAVPEPRDKGQLLAILRDVTPAKRLADELRESQRAMSMLLSNLPGMAYRCRNDRRWTMEFVSEGARALCGCPPHHLIGNRRLAYNDLIHPADRELVWREVQAAVRKKAPFYLNYRLRPVSGAEKWVWERGCGVFGPNGKLLALEGFISDITDQKHIEAQLAEERDLMQAFMENVPDVIFCKDPASRFLMVNRAKAAKLGLSSPDQAVGKTDADFYPPALAAQCLEEERRIFRSGRPLIGKLERQRFAPGLSPRWVLVNKIPFRGPDGKIRGLVGVSRDVTEIKNMERQLAEANVRLQELARTDTLTGLLNRRVILELAESEWARWKRYGGAFSVLIMDADDFKKVNDTHGHLVGDEVLVQLARRMSDSLRTVDVVGRYGGEEFMVLLPQTGLEGAGAVARKILRSVGHDPIEVGELRLQVTVSIGGASARPQDPDLDHLVQRADNSLYRAKAQGKNCLVVDDQETQAGLFKE